MFVPEYVPVTNQVLSCHEACTIDLVKPYQKYDDPVYARAMIKIVEDDITTKLHCNLPIHQQDFTDITYLTEVANQVIYLYSCLLNRSSITIKELSLRMNENRVVKFNVINNKSLEIKSVVTLNKQ